MDAIVIGAGAAGLAAAQDLTAAGAGVVVLEARDRIGGRIHTLRPPGWPVPVEAGAEFVHGRPPALLPLAPRLSELTAGHYTDGPRIARIPRGYDEVARRLARGLRIELRARVRLVRWSSAGVRVAAGRTWYEARHAVITLPLGVLQARTVRFEPGLPRWKERAIDALGMGPVVKIALLFDRAHWPDDLVFLHARGAPVPTFWRMLPSKTPALMGWAASRDAQRLSHRNAVALAVDSLAFALGKRVRPADAQVFDWQGDADARGAYSWVPVGALAAQRALARAVGPLSFAGEAAHFAGACGTVHGAIETGQRAAAEALEKLRRRRSRP